MKKEIIELKKIVNINANFQNSINLQLDLNDPYKISQYIPTSSSVHILERYLRNITDKGQEKATILTGPYGKGKSHLLLILLGILTKKVKKEILEELLLKVKDIDEKTGSLVDKEIKEHKKFLPVLISGFSESLENAFLSGIDKALKENGLKDITLNSYYSEAVDTIDSWRKNYSDTYEKFKSTVEKKYNTIEEFIERLKNYNKNSLEEFKFWYPEFTSGSEFKPIVNTDILYLYKNINEVICRKYSYKGMFIVFDEFSKFIEGYSEKNISKDMKLLQDICELCNKSESNQLHIVLVTHKGIQEYGKQLPRSVINSFEGVEGRLKEILFVTSLKSNYELIKNAIRNKQNKVEEFFMINKSVKNELMMLYKIPIFKGIIAEKEFYEVILRGCFPMHPIAVFMLMRISEMAAQNERTLFTFLSKDEPYSLVRFIKNHRKGEECFLGVECIYDYFKGILKKNVNSDRLHREWVKAEYAIKKAQDNDEQKLIKTLALIELVNLEDEFPANSENLRNSLYWEEDRFIKSAEALKKKNILIKRRKNEAYTFKNEVNVDIEKEINNVIHRYYQKIDICNELSKISRLEYILPKRYNQQFHMTRYFRYKFLLYEDFVSLVNSEYLFEEKDADGIIIAIVSENTCDRKEIVRKLKELGNMRIVVIIPENIFKIEKVIKEYLAVIRLMKDVDFIDNNKALSEELNLYEEDLIYEINDYLEKNYLPENSKCSIYNLTSINKNYYGRGSFNRLLSSICGVCYNASPKINNELINRRKISTQIQKARNRIIETLLEKKETESFLKGTSSEATIFRAAFIATGIYGDNGDVDKGTQKLIKVIHEFVETAGGTKRPLKDLYDKLLGEGLGVRKGIIPIYLAYEISKLEGISVIYFKQKELKISADILNLINENPERYTLYVEKETIEKARYLSQLKSLFGVKSNMGEAGIYKTAEGIVEWYRSLPKYTINFSSKKDIKGLKDFRNILIKQEQNPRELIFEKFPSIFEGDYDICIKKLEEIKRYLDLHIIKEKKKIAQYTKVLFKEGESGNLNSILLQWYGKYEYVFKSSVQGVYLKNFIDFVKNIRTYNEAVIVNGLAKIFTGLYIEDWNEKSLLIYQENLKGVIQESELLGSFECDNGGKRKISFINSRGEEVIKYFDKKEDSTSDFFKNAIEETIEEFGESLEINQKVSVLVDMLEHMFGS